jgi:hypothetical protein
MNFLNKLTQTLFTSGESQPGSEGNLMPEYVPGFRAEYDEIGTIVASTLQAMNRHPETHPHLVAQMNRDKIAQPILAQAMARPNVEKSLSSAVFVQEAQSPISAEVQQLPAEFDDNLGFRVPDDLSGEATPTEVAAARANVAASYQTNPEVPTLAIPSDWVDAISSKAEESHV